MLACLCDARFVNREAGISTAFARRGLRQVQHGLASFRERRPPRFAPLD